ncbi:MAG: TetR/AcrR family transcriptional regulator [Lachnospiraceae bacterium]|nr:TetR/AcrR family transcriptional regulator [Lachnospiraceae bacterium]
MKLGNFSINLKTEFTRKCIGDAVLKLLKNKSIDKLRISEIAREAGVSRTTFYQHYVDVYSVLEDYLKMIVSEYLTENERLNFDGKFFSFDHIVFSFKFFDGYSDFFHTLVNNRLHSIAFNAINDFMNEHIKKEYKNSLYILYAYAGALLNSFLQWIEDGEKEDVFDIARTLEGVI